MDTAAEKWQALEGYDGPWARRIRAELAYAIKLDHEEGGRWEPLLQGVLDRLRLTAAQEGVITKSAALAAEEALAPLASRAKSLRVLCVAHAHIDMNWMWNYAETVAVALDTFRTMLNLMNEYPGFTFSQSQASVYRVVEQYDPGMLEEIRARVAQGRWEVTASHWVEADKNMPSGESLARHLLYTRRYLSRLLELDPASLNLDFEPDTFGHSRNVPEILSQGGVRYYYHCRGYEGHNLYRWLAPSAASVLAYHEPIGYNAAIDPEVALPVPAFCSRYGLDAMLKVYGVGDHGGGPTRRDVERILEMDSWPIFPHFQFSTYREFFREAEAVAERLPVVDEELNFVFSGCYTTQTRIKTANRVGEARLYDAEAYAAASALLTGGAYPREGWEDAWRKVLFNQFHDILTGSGVVDTREYAMGQFQQVLATANTAAVQALRRLAAAVDTSALLPQEDGGEVISEGAGTGFGVTDYGLPQTERGRGKHRLFHLFNPSAHERLEPVELTLWDWPGDEQRLEVVDGQGNPLKHQVVSGRAQQLHPSGAFWGHKYLKLLVQAWVPALGAAVCLVRERPLEECPTGLPSWERVETPDSYVLENDRVRVRLCTRSAAIQSFVDKRTGREMIDSSRPCGVFRLIAEDPARGMTSWIVGRHMTVQNLTDDVRIGPVSLGRGQLRQWVTFRVAFGGSKLEATVSLTGDAARLEYEVECDWQERPVREVSIPQLGFHLPVGYRCRAYQYDVPFGAVSREALDMDLPGQTYALALPEVGDQSALRLVAKSRYGFRGCEDALNLTLLRSSYDPDPYPELGVHRFGFAVDLVDGEDNRRLAETSFDYQHPIAFVSGSRHEGNLPAQFSLLKVEAGSVVLSAVKLPEEPADRRLLVRLYEVAGQSTEACLRFGRPVCDAWFTDVHENPLEGGPIAVEGYAVRAQVAAGHVATICVEFSA